MTTLEIMQQVKEGKLSEQQATQLIEEQSATAVKAAKKKKVSLKVSNKGGLQFDGIRRFPITLYIEEWRLIDNMREQTLKFIDEHRQQLTVKVEE